MSGKSKNFPDNLKNCLNFPEAVWKTQQLSGQSRNCSDNPKSVRTIQKLSGQSRNYSYNPTTVWTIQKLSYNPETSLIIQKLNFCNPVCVSHAQWWMISWYQWAAESQLNRGMAMLFNPRGRFCFQPIDPKLRHLFDNLWTHKTFYCYIQFGPDTSNMIKCHINRRKVFTTRPYSQPK